MSFIIKLDVEIPARRRDETCDVCLEVEIDYVGDFSDDEVQQIIKEDYDLRAEIKAAAKACYLRAEYPYYLLEL